MTVRPGIALRTSDAYWRALLQESVVPGEHHGSEQQGRPEQHQPTSGKRGGEVLTSPQVVDHLPPRAEDVLTHAVSLGKKGPCFFAPLGHGATPNRGG